MLKRLTTILVLLSLAGIVAGWVIRADAPSMIAFVLAGYAALLVAALGLWVLSAHVFLRFLGAEARVFYRTHLLRLMLAVLLTAIVAGVVLTVVNKMWLPGRFHVASLGADAAVVLCAFVVAGALLNRGERRGMIIASAGTLTVLVVGVLGIVGSGAARESRAKEMHKLATLPYLTWVPADDSADKAGVTYYEPEHAFAGVNIYNPRNLSAAYLIDMEGNILHEWSADIIEDDDWVFVEMRPNGDLLAIVDEQLLVALDWDSNVKWTKEITTHHDIAVDSDGTIYTLTKRQRIVRPYGVPLPIGNEQITKLAPDHTIAERIDLYNTLQGSIPLPVWITLYGWLARPANLASTVKAIHEGRPEYSRANPLDVFHSNTVEIIDQDIDNVFKRGNLLYCARNLNLVGVIDPTSSSLLWSWGPGELEHPHHPTLLENGHILIFDNGVFREWSRVVEVDPATGEIVWQFKADPPELFYSHSRGGNQRLPNGNTLITNSDNGHAFEVTPDGHVVWEFYNPVLHRQGKKQTRAAIYRLMRITDPENYPCLQRLQL